MDPEAVQSHIRALKAAGANFINLTLPFDNVFNNLKSPFSFALAMAARREGLPFGGYDEDIPAIEASDSGVSILDDVMTAGGLDTLCLEAEKAAKPASSGAAR